MDLELDIDLRAAGRASRPVTADYVRDLNLADIAALSAERGIKAPSIKNIRDSHHKIAMAFAQGLKPREVAIATGYSLSRISILSKDPAMTDLIESYREEVRAGTMVETIDLVNRNLLLATDTIAILHERVVEREGGEDELSTRDLKEIAEMSLDRAGHAPQRNSTNVNVNVLSIERLEQARRRASIIEGSLVPLPREEPGT